jgi:glyoxylase-like metal-dependent hydrolase (beta-lactamase superfamily II)
MKMASPVPSSVRYSGVCCYAAPVTGESLPEREIGYVTVLFGENGGKYPSGNSLVVRGSEQTAIIDPSLGLYPRRAELPRVDRIINSHCHEDHIAGNSLFVDVPCHLHELDIPGLASLEAMLDIYGFPEPIHSAWRRSLVEQFHFEPRPDARPYRDGDTFELGGVSIRVIHAPGHTRGHCLLWVEPGELLYLADIDLSSFGPYYGDAWSSLDDFVTTLARVREIEAQHYATFHHVGVLDGRDAFLERLDRFEAVIADRERRLLEYLAEPHTLDEIAEHRFVYRPGDAVAFATPVERWSMEQHIRRLIEQGAVAAVEADCYRVV